MRRRRSESPALKRNLGLKGVGIFSVGKSAENAETQKYCKASAEQIEDLSRLPRKSSKHIVRVPVP
jgi:hypothetical protein